MGAIAQAIRGTLYMMHWFVVMVSMTLRVSIRPKRLKWVKTVHHGAEFNSPLPETPEPSAEA
jgi:1,2-diacylglycerol 3-beta-glucosyltransferase